MDVKRTEHKYIVRYEESLQFRQQLDRIMPRDIHCSGMAGYEVRSLYFDTVGDRCCAEKEDGLLDHEKIRIRTYDPQGQIIKLESKKKRGEVQRKRSMVISREICDCLCTGRYSVLLDSKEPDAMYFYRKLAEGMVPKAVVQYSRMSYCLPVNNTRITFDTDIRATESCLDLFRDPLQAHPILPEDLAVVEVKFNNFLLGYIRSTLDRMNWAEGSFSKYFSGRSHYRYLI
jgi:hypothetical protein